VCEENQKCLPCDGMGYSKIGIEYTTLGDYSCTVFLLELQDANCSYIASMDKCEAPKKEYIICSEIANN
jgi:hypothetical protein